MLNKLLNIYESNTRSLGFVMVLLLLWLLINACSENQTNRNLRLQHFGEIRTNTENIFIDPVHNKVAMAASKEGDVYSFISYKVGFEKINMYDKQKGVAWQKYMDNQMEKDWLIVANNDTLPVVFSQPVVKKYKNITESVLVFEVPKTEMPTQLIYKGTIDNSGVKTFLLNGNKE